MNARERILKAIDREVPDRIPTFIQSIMPGFKKGLLNLWGDDFKKKKNLVLFGRDFNIEKKLGFDCAWHLIGIPVTPPKGTFQEHPIPQVENASDRFVDYEGRVFKKSDQKDQDAAWYLTNYITTEEMADYFYDSYYSVEWEAYPRYVEKVNKRLKKFPIDEFMISCDLFQILEPIWEGLGLGLVAKLLRKNKAKIKRYIELRTKVAVKWAKIAAETDLELFNLADDTAYKNKVMIDPRIHRELVVPAYKKVVREIRKAGKFVFFHSDGFTEPYFPGLIEAGFHGVESLEPGAGMDLKHLKEEYGDKLCLIGNIDVSELLPYGTTEQVVEAVKKCIKDAGEGGGYILSPCTDITNACKLDNILAMMKAIKKYGQYPLTL